MTIKPDLMINKCPTCGSENIQFVVKDLPRNYKGQTYIVPNIGVYECSNCGEKVFNRNALQKIREHSPAYLKSDVEG